MLAQVSSREDLSPLALSVESVWQDLCSRYLPIHRTESIWRYSRPERRTDQDQGWKLHVSATVLNANNVLQAVGPFLRRKGVLFKGPNSLYELSKLNRGLDYGYTQVGKCLTIYPQTTAEAVSLAQTLDELTTGINAPTVPFDLQLKPGSCIFYRYGAFQHKETEENGINRLALRNPEGRLVPDLRDSPELPHWVSDPFREARSWEDRQVVANPLKTSFRVFSALSQRGKGGVYLAVDYQAQPPRLCVLKEGRRDGEPSWDGSDGYSRVKKEKDILIALRSLGLPVPLVYTSFEIERHFYLVTEFISGISLDKLLGSRRRRLPVLQVLKYGVEVALLLDGLHSNGWQWRDCKPSNLQVTEGTLRPFDFEGACPIAEINPTPWGTPAFSPPEILSRSKARNGAAGDLYALGILLYYLMTGKYPVVSDLMPVDKLRRNVPQAVRELVAKLLSVDPERRPTARAATSTLTSVLAGQESA